MNQMDLPIKGQVGEDFLWALNELDIAVTEKTTINSLLVELRLKGVKVTLEPTGRIRISLPPFIAKETGIHFGKVVTTGATVTANLFIDLAT